jgi:hypothetical protein
MVKKSSQETATALLIDENDLSLSSEDEEKFKELSSKLAEIRKDKGVIGYIIKNEASDNRPERTRQNSRIRPILISGT